MTGPIEEAPPGGARKKPRKPPDTAAEYLTLEAVGIILGISAHTVRRMVEDGKLKRIMVRSTVRIHRDALAEWRAMNEAYIRPVDHAEPTAQPARPTKHVPGWNGKDYSVGKPGRRKGWRPSPDRDEPGAGRGDAER